MPEAKATPKTEPKKRHWETELPMGQMVYWYARGETHNRPRIAFVQESSNVGVLELIVMPNRSGEVEFVHSVHHKDYEGLKDAYGRPNQASRLHGCWDFAN